MTTAVKVNVSIDNVVAQLSWKDKVELARRLQRETRRQRWGGLLARLSRRQRRPSRPPHDA